MLHTRKSVYSADNLPGVQSYNNSLNFAAEILRPDYERQASRVSRCVHYFFRQNEYFSVFRWRSIRSNAISSELFKKWAVLVGCVLNFMFIHTVLAFILYQDDGSCQFLVTEVKCEEEMSMNGLYSRCEWRWDGHRYCHMRSPLKNKTAVCILLAVAAFLAVPLNEYWFIAVESVIEHYLMSDETVTSDSIHNLPEVQSMNNKKAETAHKEFLTQAHVSSHSPHNVMIVNEGARQGTPEDEVDYILMEAKGLMTCEELESIPDKSFSLELHKNYLISKLCLDQLGNLRARSSRDKLIRAIKIARHSCNDVMSTLSLFKDEELKNIFLIEQFLLSCLPKYMRFFLSKHFFYWTNYSSEFRAVGDTRRYFGKFLSVYVACTLSLVLALGFQWLGRVTNVTWAYLILGSVVVDFIILSPFRIFVRDCLIPAVFMRNLRELHKDIRKVYLSVLKKMRDRSTIPSLELVQHFNPSCRAARQIDSCTAISESLMYFKDTDLPRSTLEKDPLPGFWNGCTRAILFLIRNILFGLFLLVPELAVDCAINALLTIFIIAMVSGLVVIGRFAVIYPFILIVVAVLFLTLREIGTRRSLRCVHFDSSSHDQVFSAGRVLENLNYSIENSDFAASHDDFTKIREALLTVDVPESDMDKFESFASQCKPSTKENRALNGKVIPISDHLELPLQGNKLDDGGPNSRKTTFLRTDKQKKMISDNFIIATEDSFAAVDNNYVSYTETPRSRANFLAPISLTKSTVPRFNGPSIVSKPGRMHISGRDYQILTAAVGKFFLIQEEMLNFDGAVQASIVEWVVRQSHGGIDITRTSDKIAVLVKRESKILRKVIKRILEKDKILVVTEHYSRGRLYNLSRAEDIRNKLFSIGSPVKQKNEFARGANLEIPSESAHM